MAEIKLRKRYKYAGDIFQRLIGLGLDVETATAFLDKVEDADVEEVRHGYFKRNERNIPKMKEFHEKGIALSMNEKSIFYTCSCCGSWCSLSQNYCSECGAKMDGTPKKKR